MSAADRLAAELLIDEAARFSIEARYADQLRAAQAAVEVARALGALDLEVRAILAQASAYRMLGDDGTALQRLTWILTVASDPARRDELSRSDLTWHIARAHMDWVACARFLPEIAAADLFRVIDAGEAYLRAVGKPQWRAGLAHQRSKVLNTLGRTAEAVGPAEEALALELSNPGAPGYTLATYRWSLGDLLNQLGRHADARRHYCEVLDDSGSPMFDRKVAHEGLGWCALAEGDAAAARRDAEAAARLAEGMGDDALCPSLSLLVEACRTTGDLPAARHAAARNLKAARRIGSDYRLYFALRDAADVALDAGDGVAACAALDGAQPLAHLLDRQRGNNGTSREIAQRRQRLQRLGAAE